VFTEGFAKIHQQTQDKIDLCEKETKRIDRENQSLIEKVKHMFEEHVKVIASGEGSEKKAIEAKPVQVKENAAPLFNFKFSPFTDAKPVKAREFVAPIFKRTDPFADAKPANGAPIFNAPSLFTEAKPVK